MTKFGHKECESGHGRVGRPAPSDNFGRSVVGRPAPSARSRAAVGTPASVGGNKTRRSRETRAKRGFSAARATYFGSGWPGTLAFGIALPIPPRYTPAREFSHTAHFPRQVEAGSSFRVDPKLLYFKIGLLEWKGWARSVVSHGRQAMKATLIGAFGGVLVLALLGTFFGHESPAFAQRPSGFE